MVLGVVAAGAYALAALYDTSGGDPPAEPATTTTAVPATAPTTTAPPTTQPPTTLLPFETNPRGPGSGTDNAEEFRKWLEEEIRKRFLDD
jgi:hypothetical protein